MAGVLRVAVGQMCSGDHHAVNIQTVTQFALEAAEGGAAVLALPEVAGLMNRDASAARALVGPAPDDPYLRACADLAARHCLWLHAGSTPVAGPGGRFLNHSALFDATGGLVAEYDKIHLFDVALEGQAPIGESQRFAPGDKAVAVRTPWGLWGLTICYDLRFAHLFGAYAQAGAGVILVPSAFTVPTGRAHWEVLLRARAIETGCFIIAPAQVGRHADGRETWGHSLVIDPWGTVLLDMGGAGPGLGFVDLDLAASARARAQIPNLANARPFDLVIRDARP